MFMLATTSPLELILIAAYLLAILTLGWMGYVRTKSAADYLVAGRGVHPYIMAMSYGATFISTSAIVGFAGVAGMFGMSVMWLVFLNIFVGIFIAFVFIGGRTRRMGHQLGAHTFSELIGKRYESKTIRVLVGSIISIFIPLYAAAVFIGGCEFLTSHFSISYNLSLLIFAIIVASYVVTGGLKGIMYVEAMQGTIMLVCMIILLVFSYEKVGGVVKGHTELANMSDQVFAGFKQIGHRGWTSFPKFGWGERQYDLWWIVVSSIIFGVGFGVLAQPQLCVRFMTVKSQKELNRAVILGSIFILFIPGTAYVVANLSNVYFNKIETVHGRILTVTENADVVVKKTRDTVKTIPCRLLHIDTDNDNKADVNLIANGIGGASAIMPAAQITELGDGLVEIRPNATAFKRALALMDDGKWMLNPDSIIPNYIQSAMPKWFSLLFLLTLLSAGMSTLSSQFHALGSSFAHDVYTQIMPKNKTIIKATRTSIILGIILAMWISAYARGGYIVARATAIFFGLCLSAFLPAFLGGLFFKRMTRQGALASILVGFVVTVFWLVFIKAAEADAIGIVQHLTNGKSSLLADYPNWPVVDPCFVALPLSVLTAIVVSLITKPHSEEHLAKCFASKA